MKCILTAFLFLIVSMNLFSMPEGEGELEEKKLDAQDSISLAIDKMEFSKAIAIIDRLLLTDLDSVNIRSLSFQKARSLKKLYKFNDAINILAEINTSSADMPTSIGGAIDALNLDVEVLTEIADAHISLGDMNSAITIYILLRTVSPGNLYYALRYINLLYRQELFEDVISEGKYILTIEPTYYSVLSLVGDSFSKIEKSDSALVYYNRMLEVNPIDVRVLNKKAKILLSKEKYPEVIDLTQDYLSQDSLNLIMNSVCGLALHLDTQYEESINIYNRLMSLGDSTYNTHYCMGLNYYMLDDYFDAERYFEKAFKADSSDVNMVYHYAISTTWQTYRIDRSIKLLDYAYSLTQPDSLVVGKVYSGYASTYFKSKKYKEAIPYYIKAYKYNTNFVSALSTLGYCYEKEKDYRKAKEYYQAYLKLTDDSDGYTAIEKRLEKVTADLFMIEN